MCLNDRGAFDWLARKPREGCFCRRWPWFAMSTSRRSLKNLRTVFLETLYVNMFCPVTKYVLSCRSWATMIPAVASIVRKISLTVSIKSPGSPVHCFGGRLRRLFGNHAEPIFAHTGALSFLTNQVAVFLRTVKHSWLLVMQINNWL